MLGGGRRPSVQWQGARLGHSSSEFIHQPMASKKQTPILIFDPVRDFAVCVAQEFFVNSSSHLWWIEKNIRVVSSE